MTETEFPKVTRKQRNPKPQEPHKSPADIERNHQAFKAWMRGERDVPNPSITEGWRPKTPRPES